MEINRREAIGSLGTLALAGGLNGLLTNQGQGQDPVEEAAGKKSAKFAQSLLVVKDYALPPLNYAYDALEPHIDAETMKLHHDKHHLAYVNGLNNALKSLEAVRATATDADNEKIHELSELVAFHGSGHALHSIFWTNMKKDGGSDPKGALGTQIDREFGSFSKFQNHFAKAASVVMGSGWSMLAFDPLGQRMLILSIEKHQNNAMMGVVPLLVLDVWEHAYYLKYQNRRADYIKAFWNVIDWDNVATRLATAQKLCA